MKKNKKQQKNEETGKKLLKKEAPYIYNQPNCFSTEFCSKYVTIDQKNPKLAIANSKAGFVFCQSQLDVNGVSQVRFRIILNHFHYSVYLGIANISLFQKQNYFPNLKKLGHGAYLISKDSKCFSNHQKDHRIPFNIENLQQIALTVDYPQGMITWNDLKKGKEFLMKFNNKENFQPVVGIRQCSIEILD